MPGFNSVFPSFLRGLAIPESKLPDVTGIGLQNSKHIKGRKSAPSRAVSVFGRAAELGLGEESGR